MVMALARADVEDAEQIARLYRDRAREGDRTDDITILEDDDKPPSPPDKNSPRMWTIRTKVRVTKLIRFLAYPIPSVIVH